MKYLQYLCEKKEMGRTKQKTRSPGRMRVSCRVMPFLAVVPPAGIDESAGCCVAAGFSLRAQL
jgi:hypothetical protein